MKHPTDRQSISAGLVWLILTICVVGSPIDVHGQIGTSTEIPVQDIEDLETLTRLAITLQLIFAPEALARVNPLYAYNAAELTGTEVHPERIGSVATVRRCPDSEEETWCAQYFTDVNQAFDAAYEASARDPGSDTYFATTYPLPNIVPKQRFVSGLLP